MKGSFVWNGNDLPENICFEILIYKSLHLSQRKKGSCLVGLVDPPFFTGVLTCRCQNRAAGRQPYSKETSLASVFFFYLSI